ncbi:MAG: glycosyltransferase [bacterium]
MYKVTYLIEKFITQHADEVITSNEGLKTFIINNFKVKSITVEKDLPDRSMFNPGVQPATLAIPKNKIVIVYLGGLQLYKGIDYLLKAIPYTNHKYHFLIMGYPDEECRIIAKKLGIMDRITFTGKIPYEQAPSYLKLGRIAISPKTTESGEANAKLYNYLAMGLKVICFDIPENHKILKGEGIYVKERNINDLINKINELVV